MGRWYDSVDNKSSNIVYSRIRLARNWDEDVYKRQVLPLVMIWRMDAVLRILFKSMGDRKSVV